MQLLSYWERHLAPKLELRELNDRGSVMVEYVLLAMLIALVCVLAVTFLGNATNDHLSNVGSFFTP